MAQHAKTSALTDELIRSIIDFDPAANRQAYKHAKDIAARGLRGHQFARTNQFQVDSTLAGLDEKFRVKDRDDLANALQTRLQRLESVTSRFKPEYLSLLLHLADRPLENTKVGALELLHPPPSPQPLIWDDILHDDPYSDDDIWKDIDYAAGSSGDEKVPKKRPKAAVSPPTSVDEDDTYDLASCTSPVDNHLALNLASTQFWSSEADEEDTTSIISELQAVRESLFMLAGLKTSLYLLDQQHGTLRINTCFALTHARSDAVQHLLSDFVKIGKDIYHLRQWTQRSSPLPLIQTFEAAVRTRLVAFDCALAELQQQYLTPSHPGIAVSLLQLYKDVLAVSTPLLHLAQIIADIEAEIIVKPFRHLEALFEHITLAQMTLEISKFEYLSHLFFDCIQTYLEPIRTWMELGELRVNNETFFIFENNSGNDATSLWHDHYALRHDARNDLRSPSFLQPAAKKIFTTGKSIVFLKELGIRGPGTGSLVAEPQLNHATVCGNSDEVPVSPFPELFQAAFDGWMQSKYSQASAVLRRHLVEESGLMRILVLLETLYLGKNGAVFEEFAIALFERMDAGRKGWNDRYVLTEIARGIFGTVMPIPTAEKIVVRSSKTKVNPQSVESLSAVSLDFAISWPVQNVIQRSSIPIYQQLFTFLLQTYRLKYRVQAVRPSRNSHLNSLDDKIILKLQHRLTWFTDMMRSYLTENAIFFTTQEMDVQMEKAEDIDEMAQVHLKFVARLQERALMSQELKLIHKTIIEILDLGMKFTEILATSKPKPPRRSAKRRARSMWQKHDASSLVLEESLTDSDEDSHDDDQASESSTTKRSIAQTSVKDSLQFIDSEFSRLLHFVIAGLRSVGRVGAEPMWEQLADRLDWTDRKRRT
ncbi:Spc98 family-domain-containing protein [Phaeosphaeria sp. MPI-PUGE-AT-0046c]|nr:Spc98 family-domain-containing protein [Phaeosphaeria sp. MPI-PUGE-AT-0046c]